MKKILLIALLFAGCTRSVNSPDSTSNGDAYLKYHIGNNTTETVFTGDYAHAVSTKEGVYWIKFSDDTYAIEAAKGDYDNVMLYAFTNPADPIMDVFLINGKLYNDLAFDDNGNRIRTVKITITKNNNDSWDGTFSGSISGQDIIQITGEFKNVKSKN